MTPKQIRMMQLLDEQIQSCERCGLHTGGRCKPYWSINSKHAMILEAPGKEEVKQNTPVVGPAGEKLWEMVQFFNMKKSDFLIINSVNCRPTDGQKNLKPTLDEIQTCKHWVEKYLKVLDSPLNMVFGNYGMFSILGESSGIMKRNAELMVDSPAGFDIILSVHPATMIYRGDDGKKDIYSALKKFCLYKKKKGW